MKNIKADDKVKFEGDNGKMVAENYTEFQLLKARVDVLQEQVQLMGKILKQQGFTELKETYDLTLDLMDEAFKKVEE